MVAKEGMQLSLEAMQAFAVAAGNDMRQVTIVRGRSHVAHSHSDICAQALNSLQLWTAGMLGVSARTSF